MRVSMAGFLHRTRSLPAFTWKARPATSQDDGTGFFTVVGGYDVIVYWKGRPVTGGVIYAGSTRELARRVTPMLTRFAKQFGTFTPAQRTRTLRIAAQTAKDRGWSRAIA